jgi:hypothetical protein
MGDFFESCGLKVVIVSVVVILFGYRGSNLAIFVVGEILDFGDVIITMSIHYYTKYNTTDNEKVK